MDSKLTAKLVTIRRDTLNSLNGLNGKSDKHFKGFPGNIENYRVGWAKSSLNSALESLNELLVERDALMYEMETRSAANDKSGDVL